MQSTLVVIGQADRLANRLSRLLELARVFDLPRDTCIGPQAEPQTNVGIGTQVPDPAGDSVEIGRASCRERV